MAQFRTVGDAANVAREFAVEVMRPRGLELDRMTPAQSVAPDSPAYEVHREYRRRGLHRMMLPGSLGGSRESVPPGTSHRVSEELGYGDPGLAIGLAASGMPFALMSLSASSEVRSWVRDYTRDLDARMIGCWGITEPAHGSDWVLGTTRWGDNPALAANLTARLEGDEYVINGQKSAWVSNGTLATHAVLHVGLDASRGMHGTGIALLRLDLPGISKGLPLDKLGQRPLNQGEIYFDNVRIPRDWMLLENPAIFAIDGVGRTFLGQANLETGTVMAGLARAAFDQALAFAKQSGRYDEQAIRIQLFEMFAKVEAGSALARRAAESGGDGVGGGGGGVGGGGGGGALASLVGRAAASRPGLAVGGKAIQWFVRNYDTLKERPWVQARTRPGAPREGLRSGVYGIACKIFCTQVSYEVASQAIQIIGQPALAADHPAQKMFRDARAALIEDGTNEMLALAGSEDL